MRRVLRDHGLSLAFGALFLGTLMFQAFVGLADFNEAQVAHHGSEISLWRFLLVMGAIWIASWFGQSITGHVVYNAERFDHQQDAVNWSAYLATPDFWNRTLQNWQSEFLAVGSMAVLAIYLRQRGSPESKPVGAPHTATGVEG